MATATLIQKLKRNRTLSADPTVSGFVSSDLQPYLPLTYYTAEPNSAEGKIRNRLTSCKSFSGRASEIVTDLQAIIDPSVVKSSRVAVHHTAVVVGDGEEGSEAQAGDGDGPGEDDFFDPAEFPDDQVDDDGWESGSIHSGDDGPSNGLSPMSSDYESEPELAPTSDVDPLHHPSPKTKSKVKLRPETTSEDDDDDSAPDSGSDSDPSQLIKVAKPSGRAGTSTFLPSLSVGYIPGTGDSDPEDELEAVEGKGERKNRRGQRARRA